MPLTPERSRAIAAAYEVTGTLSGISSGPRRQAPAENRNGQRVFRISVSGGEEPGPRGRDRGSPATRQTEDETQAVVDGRHALMAELAHAFEEVRAEDLLDVVEVRDGDLR